jgi:hypothetical protein
LWKLVYLSVVDGPGKRQEIEDEKAEICQELASLGWTMEAKLASHTGKADRGRRTVRTFRNNIRCIFTGRCKEPKRSESETLSERM